MTDKRKTESKAADGMQTALCRKGSKPVLKENRKNGVLYLTFPSLESCTGIVHGFSTRIGGVSQNEFSQMNLSFSRGDVRERVLENYRRIAAAIGFDEDHIVCSDQTHTANVREVTEADLGKGFARERDYTDVDGFVTNVPDVVLATFYADCVPLYFVDPVRRAVGLSHSGWRGTVGDIAGATVRMMKEKYGTEPSDILAAIGPSICQSCYEVSEDVIDRFKEAYDTSLWEHLFYAKENGKYQLDLWEACRQNMLRAGILAEHISVTDICTCCNPEVLFSHRASHGKRGNLAAFLGIRQE